MIKLSAINQWTDCLADNRGRRPRLDPKHGKGISLARAQKLASTSEDSPLYGFIFSKDDPYYGIDIDVDPTGKKPNSTKVVPQELLLFMLAHPTHCHYSPGGHGLHLIYKLTKSAIKQVNKLQKKQGACKQDDGALFNGDWRWDNSFLTFTQNLHEQSTDISTIDYDTLIELVGEKKDVPDAPVVDINTGLTMQMHIPSLDELINTLQNVPPTYNHLARKACKLLKHSQPETNYEYWLLVGQACAHTAVILSSFGADTVDTVEAEFVAWSAKDPEFVSIEDVQKKFRSLLQSTRTKIASGEVTASFKVLSSLARGAIINFPILAGKNLTPDMNAIKNFEYLMKYEGLTVWLDTMSGGFSVKGPEATVAQWFRPLKSTQTTCKEGTSQVFDPGTLDTVFLPFFQHKFKQSMSSSQAKVACKHLMINVDRTNAFKDWIDSKPWDNTPRFDSICNSITYAHATDEDSKLYTSYIRKALLSMIGIHYWPEDHPKIPAMLVLTGPQHTYKSSWAEWLIPFELAQYLGTANTETMIGAGVERDRLLCTRAVLVVNECEPMFTPRHEQKIKSSVDQEMVTYRDLYASNPISRQRTALIIGTTNKPDLYTGSLGTRKIWQIPVSLCDSYLVKDTDKQQLYAEIKALLVSYKQEKPKALIQTAWAQSVKEREQVEETNRQAKGTMGIDSLLVEVFGDPLDTVFDPSSYSGKRGFAVRKGSPYSLENRPNAWTLTPLLRFMKDRFPDDIIDRKMLRYAAIAYCELHTHSKGCKVEPFKHLTRADRSVYRGQVTISKSEKYYLFPPIGNNPDSDDDGDVE